MQRGLELDRELRILILVGLPGSGKSTLAALLADSGWRVVNQDTLGDRRKCVAMTRSTLASGGRVVIDRCNVSRLQRKVWLGLADEYRVAAGCLWLDVDEKECGKRVLERFGHRTLPSNCDSLHVISSFRERLERPMEAEGFVLWHVPGHKALQVALVDLGVLATVADEICFRYDGPARLGEHVGSLVHPQESFPCEAQTTMQPTKEGSRPLQAVRMQESSGSSGDAVRCVACGLCRPREAFSKAQLTKHRSKPKCKDCVEKAEVVV